MSLVNMKEMLCEARKAHKAVGAFNITNYETAAAVLKAAEAENEPVIIQLYMRLFDTGKAYDLCGMLQRLAFRGKVPVAPKQLLNAGRGHQAPRKAAQLFERR